MGIEVELADGRVIEVDADTPEAAARAAHAYAQRNPAPRGYAQARRRERSVRDERGPAWLRPVEQFNRFTQQIPANLGIADEMAWGSALAGQGAQNLGRRLTGRPIEVPAMTAAQAAADDRNQRASRYRRENPELDTAATVAGIPALMGAPAAAMPRVSALAGGAMAAGLNAPFALARQEGPTLQERLPGAAQETALAFGLGTALQGGANWLTRQAPRSGQVAANMDRLGIPPNLATTSEGWGPRFATRFASENLMAGGRTRANLRSSLEGSRDAAERISRQYGSSRGMEDAGQDVQAALQRFTRERNIPNPQPGRHPLQVPTGEWGFASKANAVFDEALRPIEANPAQFASTQNAMDAILQQADSEAVRAFQGSSVVREFTDTLANTPNPTLRDLRELRRKIRLTQDTPNFSGQSVDNAALQRIESALTEDIYAAAGPGAARLRQADAFYRRGRENINRALAQFDPERMRNPGQTIQRIIAMAHRDTGNTRNLAVLRRSLRDPEWREVASSIIDRMGQPTPGASGLTRDIEFSVSEFAKRWETMSPEARRILFSSGSAQGRQLFQDLNDLADIIRRQKAIETMGTPSGRDVQNAMSLTSLVGAGTVGGEMGAVSVLAGMGSLALTGEALTNPAFVRWLTSSSRSGARAGGARQHLAALAQLAARDPALMPIYTEIARRAGVLPPRPEAQPQRQPEPAFQ